jgi:hypothetical protein
MSQLAHTIRHLERMNLEGRISYLRRVVPHYSEGTIIGKALREILKQDVTKKLRREAARGTQ